MTFRRYAPIGRAADIVPGAEINDLTAIVTWDDVPDANITESSVTQHEAALTITESQISDLGTYLSASDVATITGQWTFEDRVDIDNGNSLRVYDATDTDYIDISHDGTDANFTSSGTTQYTFDRTLLSSSAVRSGTDGNNCAQILFSGTQSILTSRYTSGSYGLGDLQIACDDFIFTGVGNLFLSSGFGTATFGGTTVRVASTNSTTIATAALSGNIILECENASATGAVYIKDGTRFRIEDGAETDYVQFRHDGTDLQVSGVNTRHIDFTALTGNLRLRDGADLVVFDSTDTDSITIAHTGTNATITCVGTTNLSITGAEISHDSFITTDHTAAENTSAMEVKDPDGNFRNVGFNEMVTETQNAAYTFARTEVGKVVVHTDATARVYTTWASTDTTIPDGAVWQVLNLGTGAHTIAAGSGVTLQWIDGSGASTTGTRTLAQYGICTVWKRSDTLAYIWGNGLS